MGVILAFAVGYVVGAGAGRERLEEVFEALRTVRDSQEFRELLGAVRSHAAAAFEELSVRLRDGDADLGVDELLDRARKLLRGDDPGAPTAPGS